MYKILPILIIFLSLMACQSESSTATKKKIPSKGEYSLKDKVFSVLPCYEAGKDCNATCKSDCGIGQMVFLNDSVFIKHNYCVNEGTSYLSGRYYMVKDTMVINYNDQFLLDAEIDGDSSETAPVRSYESNPNPSKYRYELIGVCDNTPIFRWIYPKYEEFIGPVDTSVFKSSTVAQYLQQFNKKDKNWLGI